MSDYFLILMGFNVLWICGVWASALPGQILDPIASWMAGDARAVPPVEGRAPEWVTKPLFECPFCMSSIHGTIWWFGFQMGPWHLWPAYVVCLCGLMKCVVILVLNRDSY